MLELNSTLFSLYSCFVFYPHFIFTLLFKINENDDESKRKELSHSPLRFPDDRCYWGSNIERHGHVFRQQLWAQFHLELRSAVISHQRPIVYVPPGILLFGYAFRLTFHSGKIVVHGDLFT